MSVLGPDQTSPFFSLSPAQLELQQRALDVGRALREDGARWDEDGARWDTANSAPYGEVRDRMREAGLLGITMPTEYGGLGRTSRAGDERLRPVDDVVVTVAAGGGLQVGQVRPVAGLLGDEPVRAKYLPQIVTGRLGCAIALNEYPVTPGLPSEIPPTMPLVELVITMLPP